MEEKKQVIGIIGGSSPMSLLKENSMGYSDEWQPYTGDYDKFEYDVKLKDGTVVENCYPNGGKFNSISDEHDGEDFGEELVSEIRFSNAPRFGLNEDVSDIPQYEWLDKNHFDFQTRGQRVQNYTNTHKDPYNIFKTHPKPPQYKREAPKVHNNDPCTCGSERKFKKCCKN